MGKVNRYELTDEVRKEYLPVVETFISNIELHKDSGYDMHLDFTDTKLNPYTLGSLLVELGYEQYSSDQNGWEMDFWITYTKENSPALMVSGTGITFELRLEYCDDFDDMVLEEDEDRDEADFFSDERFRELMELGKELLRRADKLSEEQEYGR